MWVVSACDWHDDVSESGDILRVPHRRTQITLPGDVDGEAETSVAATFVRSAGAGEKVSIVISMQGNVEDIWIVVKGLLRPISVVDIL